MDLTAVQGAAVSKVSLIGIDQAVGWKLDQVKLVVSLPSFHLQDLPSFEAWTLRIETL